MSRTTALVRYSPGQALRKLPRFDPRYRSGIVFEILERRRVLSAAAATILAPNGAVPVQAVPTIVPLDQNGAGDPAANGPTDNSTDNAPVDVINADGGQITDPNPTDANPGDADPGDGTDGSMDSTDSTDSTGDNTTGDNTDTTGDTTDPGFDWPAGWAWTLDRDPTQSDLDALLAGDSSGWIPVQNFGGLGDGQGDGVNGGPIDGGTGGTTDGGAIDGLTDPVPVDLNNSGDPLILSAGAVPGGMVTPTSADGGVIFYSFNSAGAGPTAATPTAAGTPATDPTGAASTVIVGRPPNSTAAPATTPFSTSLFDKKNSDVTADGTTTLLA